MTPSQYAAYLRQQQQKIDAYNHEVRRVNEHNRRVINEHNRKVNEHNRRVVENYNRAVRAYNSQMRANEQRRRNEIARLNSRPATVRYVTYRTSVQTLQQSFTRIEEEADRRIWEADADLFDMAEGEAANSVAVLNALEANPAEDGDDPALRQTVIGAELADIDPDLHARWGGALYALSPRNPDAARHFCTSAREILSTLIACRAPERAVLAADPNCPRTPQGSVSRRARILYYLTLGGQSSQALADFIEADIENVITLFDDFNSGTHGEAGRFDLAKLTAIKIRVEDAIRFMHRIVSYAPAI
jgi:hypothetical protein